MGPCLGCEKQRDCLVVSGMVPSRFGDESNYAGEIIAGRPCGSVAQWSECSHGMREVRVRVPVGPCAFSSPVTFGGSVWVRAQAASSKETDSSVPAWF